MKKTIAAILAWTALSVLGLQAQPLTNGVALAYFAPENQLFYRLRYPNGAYREFQRSLDDLTRMDGANGWRARLTRGNRITVTGRGKAGPERYVFERGRLVSCVRQGETNSFAYADRRIPSEDAEPPYHFGSIQEAAWHPKAHARTPTSVNQLLGGKWRKSGRLRWPFENPNENGFLYASLALLSLYLTTLSRRWVGILGGALVFAFFIPLLMTASRGSFLAFAVGLMPLVLVRSRRILRSKWTYILSALALILAVGWFSTHSSRLLTRGFKGKSAWSNEARLEMWTLAPPMMVDAPGGWKMNAGKAYLDWYEEFACFTAPGSLINDHLSKMVRMSWPARGLYAFGWFTLILGLFLTALRTRNAVPAGLFAAYAVASWFNPLMINKWLWAAPLVSLATLLPDRVWTLWRRWALAAGCAAVLMVLALLTIVGLAERTPHPYGLAVFADGPRVSVRSRNPSVWIVDDGLSLGGAFACKELRAALAADPKMAGVGYVRSCADLPERRLRKLVLGGSAGDEWLKAVSSDERLRERLPEEVVFISPPFPPSAVPPALFQCARVRYVTGEFNARYCREFDAPPAFVEIVPAMELYLSGWARYAAVE